jgi:hypothetical protein
MTNTFKTLSNRLDRIEAILEQTVTRLDRFAKQQQINTAAIAQLTAQQAEFKQELQDSNKLFPSPNSLPNR